MTPPPYPAHVAHLIRQCAALHMAYVSNGGDPFEFGNARPLDFGHWAAHRLEVMSAHELRHGEAVAIGMALDCRYASLSGLLPEAVLERIVGVLEKLGFRLWHDSLEDARALLGGLDEFREHLGGELTITLLRGTGRAVEVHAMASARVIAALNWLQARDTGS